MLNHFLQGEEFSFNSPVRVCRLIEAEADLRLATANRVRGSKIGQRAFCLKAGKGSAANQSYMMHSGSTAWTGPECGEPNYPLMSRLRGTS